MPFPIAIQRIKTPVGNLDVPIYSPADVADPSFRVNTHVGVGCYDLIAPTAATPLRVLTHKGIKGVRTILSINPVVDTFNRADSTLVGETESGQLWQSYGTQQWGILLNQIYPVDNDWDSPVFVDTGFSDNYDYSIKIAVYGSGNQIMWRIGTTNYNFMVISGTNVRHVINNTWTTMTTIPQLVSGDLLTIKVRGDIHRIYINGIEVAACIDPTHQTQTKVGFSTNSLASRFDDFRVDPVVTSPPANILNNNAPVAVGLVINENVAGYVRATSSANADSVSFPFISTPLSNKFYEMKVSIEMLQYTTNTVVVNFRNETLGTTEVGFIVTAALAKVGVVQNLRALFRTGTINPAHTYSISFAQYWDNITTETIQFKIHKVGLGVNQ